MMKLIPGNKYLFDTTVFIDMLRKRSAGLDLLHQSRYADVFVAYSIISEMELWVGITSHWTEEQHIAVLRPYRRFNINVTIARNAGRFQRELRHTYKVQKGSVPGVGDCLIAATAQFYDLRVVTRNGRDFHLFEHFGVQVDEYISK